MDEVLLLMVVLFVAYLFLSKKKFSMFESKNKGGELSRADKSNLIIPEDSVLRRHYITQLRNEIELELFPRPTDSCLQRHYDSMVAAKLEYRLASIAA
jgi:hypothetical protein